MFASVHYRARTSLCKPGLCYSTEGKYFKGSVHAIKVRHVIIPLQFQFQPIEVRSVLLFIKRLMIRGFSCNEKVMLGGLSNKAPAAMYVL